jgi:hypothetical protein
MRFPQSTGAVSMFHLDQDTDSVMFCRARNRASLHDTIPAQCSRSRGPLPEIDTDDSDNLYFIISHKPNHSIL